MKTNYNMLSMRDTSTLKERCDKYYDIVCEYYNANKYYLSETAKDALLNAEDCMAVVSGRRSSLQHNYDGCDSHISYITSLAYNKYFTDQTKNAFLAAGVALLEVFVHKYLEN